MIERFLSIYLYIEIEGTSTTYVKFSCYNKKEKSGFIMKDKTRRKKFYLQHVMNNIC